MTITTKDIENVINTWQDEVQLAEKDPQHVVDFREIAEILSLPLPTVRKILNGYKALKDNDIAYLDKHPKDREIFQAISRLYSIDDLAAPKKRGPKQKPAPEPVPEEEIDDPVIAAFMEAWINTSYWKGYGDAMRRIVKERRQKHGKDDQRTG